ncbi:MAG: C25 family cysteine peptidase, partial [Anaerolineae bacterium]
ARVIDVTEPLGPTDLGPTESDDVVAVSPGHRYWIGVPDEARSPESVRPATVLDLEALGGTTYLAIAPAPFHTTLESLLAHRRSEGHVAAVVDVRAVRDSLGTGVPDPEAVRHLVDQIPSLRYLLVVGDATAQPGGYHPEVGSLRVETPFTRTATLGETPADGLLGTDADGQLRVAVGRLPATSSDELQAMIEKTIEWETNQNTLRALVVSDDEAEFAELAGRIVQALPTGAMAGRIDVAEEGSRADLLAALRRGSVWLNYTGHGSLTVLCDDGLLRLDDSGSWRQPAVVVAWTCLAAHFVHPTQDSMAEVWLREPRGGVAAFLGPVGETTSGEQEPFLRAFYRAVGEGHRLGDAWLTALREGGSEDVRWGYVLLGDPALRLVPE